MSEFISWEENQQFERMIEKRHREWLKHPENKKKWETHLKVLEELIINMTDKELDEFINNKLKEDDDGI